MTYAIDFVLGGERYTMVVVATDADDAFEKARESLVARHLWSAALQGKARVATDYDVENWHAFTS